MEKTGVKTRQQNPSEDRINSLPDEILISILSYLTLKEAGRTSVLSGRWKNLWMSAIRLDFDATEVLEELGKLGQYSKKRWTLRQRERNKYVEWVNKVLKSHKSLVLDEFRVAFCLDKPYQKQIDEWVEYAFAKEVQRLELNLLQDNGLSCCNGDRTYTFPQGILGLSSLYDFKSLRALILREVNVTREAVQFFLHNCPLLEHLVVDGSHDLESLEVSGPSLALKHLELDYCPKLMSVTVCNTNLASIKMSMAERLVLKNVPMLVDVNISGSSPNFVRDVAVSWLSSCLSKLEVLALFDLCLTNDQGNEELIELPQLTNLKQLTIKAFAPTDYSLMDYISLIRASPNLAKFVLKLTRYQIIYRSKREFKEATSYQLQHLKVVEISGYCGGRGEIELINYFIQNAVALENIIVDPHEELPYRCPLRIEKIKKEEVARRNAKEQLEGKIPSHVKLVIL